MRWITGASSSGSWALTRPDPRVVRVALLIAGTVLLGAFIGAVSGEKLLFLYKEELHLSASDVGTLNILLGLPAYLQPFMGAFTDLFPFFGAHRRSYYVLAALVQAAGYAGLVPLHHYHYASVALLVLLTGSGGILLGVMANAAMVQIGNLTGTFGRLRSLKSFIPLVLGLAYTSHLGGYVAQNWSYSRAFAVVALLCLLRGPLAALIDEKAIGVGRGKPTTAERRADREQTVAALHAAAASPGLWAIVGFVFYLLVTPGLNTAQLFYQTDVLGFSKQTIGDLGRFGSAGAILAILMYGAASRWLPVRSLVWGAWLMDTVSYLILLGLHDLSSARIVAFALAWIFMVYALCLDTIAARACPPGIEGSVFGLVLAAIALGHTLNDKFGSALYDWFGPAHGYSVAHGWYATCWFGFVFTAFAAGFIPFLPGWARSAEPLHPRGTV